MTGKEQKHSYTGASSCERWVNCPASVQLHKQVGDSPANFYAAEGTKAHSMAEYCLKHQLSVVKNGYMQGWLGRVENVEGYDIPVTQEMIDGVRLYVDTICEDMYYDGLTRNIDGFELAPQQSPPLLVEQHVDLGFGECFGTVDAAYYTEDTLTVYDLKFGKGIDVNPEENSQALFYALGIAKYIMKRKLANIKTVIIKIIQPRSPLGVPIKVWRTDIDRLRTFEKVLKEAIRQVELVPSNEELRDGWYSVNDKWCRWCPGKLVCPELKKQMHEAAKNDFCHLIVAEEKTAIAKQMSNIELSTVLKNEKLIKNFLETARDEAYARLDKGEQIPGFELISKQGNRVWTSEAESKLRETFVQNEIDANELFETKMLTPAKVEKLLKGKGVNINLDEFTTRPNSLSVGESKTKHSKAVEQFKDAL